MKISDEEVNAATAILKETGQMRLALEAAREKRKARKAAKRAKAKPSILDEYPRWAQRQANLPQFTVSSKTISAICDRWKADIEAAKQAQTETAKPEQSEHRFKVGDRVVHAIHGQGSVVSIAESYLPYRVDFGDGRRGWFGAARISPAPAAPAWNGKYEPGKSYRTRDGRKATDVFVGSDFVAANIDGAPYNFHIDGSFSVRMTGGLHPLDIIGPWED